MHVIGNEVSVPAVCCWHRWQFEFSGTLC